MNKRKTRYVQRRRSGWKRRPLSMLLALLMLFSSLLSVMPAMETLAGDYEGNPYAALVNTTTTVKFNNLDWYIIEDNSTAVNEGTLTLLAKDVIEKNMAFRNSNEGGNNAYRNCDLEAYLDGLITSDNDNTFKYVAGAIKSVDLPDVSVSGAKLYLLSVDEVKYLPKSILAIGGINWWLRTPNTDTDKVYYVKSSDARLEICSFYAGFGLRPALQLDLSSVIFDPSDHTFELPGAVTSVSLDKTEDQTIVAGDRVAFTATVSPDNAADRTVRWGVTGTGNNVTLYSDPACTSPITTGTATDILTVYAKGTEAGSATVSVKSNSYRYRRASCGITVLAYEDNPYSPLLNTTNTVSFNNKDWHIIADDSTAAGAGTLTLFAKEPFKRSEFGNKNTYSTSTVKNYLDGLTEENGSFAGVADAIKSVDLPDVSVNGARLYLLSEDEAAKVPAAIRKFEHSIVYYFWLRTADENYQYFARCVEKNSIIKSENTYTNAFVRPALQLNLSYVDFSTETKTFTLRPKLAVSLSGGTHAQRSGGAASQNGIVRAMDTVTYTADENYHFEEFAPITSNGITAERTSATVVTVSGTPTADTNIMIPSAVKDKHSATVSFKVVNGKWGDDATADKEVTLSEDFDQSLKLAADQIPTVGGKPNDGYKAGSWDVTPDTETAITGPTVYTYTYAAKETAGLTTAPEALSLTCNGEEQELVSAGQAEGGTLYYALGENEETAPEFDGLSGDAERKWSTDIPKAKDTGTYYVWYMVKGDETHLDREAVCIEAEIKAKAASSYSVRFDLNGHGEAVSTLWVKGGHKVKRPADPEAEGFDFGGWYTDKECTKEYDFDKAVRRSFTLYAKWTEKSAETFTVSFDMQQHGEQIPEQKVVSGAAAEKPADPEAEGYTFGGWFTSPDCKAEGYYDFDTPVTADITLYAKWTEKVVPVFHSALDSVPVIEADTTELYLVKGQKFIIGKEWSVKKEDKDSKALVSISKKSGLLKVKKAGKATIWNGERSLVLNISTPSVPKKLSLQITADGAESKAIGLKNPAGLPVYWYSAAPDVVMVGPDGKVTAVSAGKAKITAYINGSAYKCTVTVKEAVPAKERSLHMTVGTKKLNIKGVKDPVWSSADEETASFDKNKLTAKKAGDTILTATAADGTEYKVHLYIENITLSGDGLTPAKGRNKYNLTLKAGESTELSFVSLEQPFVFKSSKPDSAFIDESGKVSARTAGKSKFTTKINGKTIIVNVIVEE